MATKIRNAKGHFVNKRTAAALKAWQTRRDRREARQATRKAAAAAAVETRRTNAAAAAGDVALA